MERYELVVGFCGSVVKPEGARAFTHSGQMGFRGHDDNRIMGPQAGYN